MKCLICGSKMEYFFSKNYSTSSYKKIMSDIPEVKYNKCSECGFTISNTHLDMSFERWKKLNYDFHSYIYLQEHNETIGYPPYLEQATMVNVLLKNNIIGDESILDFAGGSGLISKTLDKYFNINLPVYDPYVQSKDFKNYVNKEDLTTYKTVFNSALFEHILKREEFDSINALVSTTGGGAMIIHTVICENVPKDPNWFYLEPPVHTTFHTNKSMSILMEQWGYKASIYCLSAKSWVLLKDASSEIEEKVKQINQEFQTEYLIYKEGFVDYWKGF